MQKRLLAAIPALWLGTIPHSLANSIEHQEKPVIVTATRTAQTADTALASVTVISRKDIEQQQARSVQDLLRGVAGISISNNGGMGKSSFVFMRGTESDHVLVLVDNIKVGSATSGTTAFENIPIDQIERVEIVRGPRSSLYGSEAIGGVIHIITRKGTGSGFRQHLNFGGGSFGTFEGATGMSYNGTQGWLNLTASGIGTQGFNACNGTSSAGCFVDSSDPALFDRDGYRNVAGSMRGGYRFQNGLEIETNFMQSAGKTHYDGSFVNKTVLMQQVVGGTIRYAPTTFWNFNLIAGSSREDSDNLLGTAFQSRFNTTRDNVSVLNTFTVAKDQQLTLGMDYQRDHIKSNYAFEVMSRTNWGVFAQHQANIAAHNLQFSVRHDDNQQFGSRVTGNAGWSYPLSDKFLLIANFGSAFKAPTFNELYFPGFSNPNLKPEDSLSYEFGTRGHASWGNWSISAYETRIDNLITYDARIFAPNNIDQARIRGIEGILSTQIMAWQINTNLTLMEPVDRGSGSDRGNILPRRAEQSFRLDLNREFGRYTVGSMLLVEGQRYDDLANTQKLNAYAKLDLRAEYLFAPKWRLQGRIDNVSDEHYETAAFYNQAGRSFFAMVRYQP
ncbi:MAG: TonB-dependent vitamin B12 receptor [Nitrosomonas sp.]|jgi:vitamin B12 transporter|uniref:TonB-dependent vitamin B12 receptor n=1 Tax=Nitrosomonas sp. TaxID=42353 RepID=UPI001D37C832|nr:TonB-dependent vitamin B12 receptor [Nitrosomonas sp.]MBX9893965.1 TonB-dependent vitamin B12 receptor [Nitrosomonas sp.]